ncbi:MAG: sensor histidine kinase, partial [Erythrobacter sp.]|nr:sensor histidine kinase [Erythrobacter sp.]
DCVSLIRSTIAQLAPVLEPRGGALAFACPATTELLVAIDPDDAEVLVWRLLASLAAACGAEEQIALRLDPVIGGGIASARLTIALPARLASEDNLFAATARGQNSAINAGLFGAGFALRLARAEAQSAGGSLIRDAAEIILTLPLLTDRRAEPGDVEDDSTAALA